MAYNLPIFLITIVILGPLSTTCLATTEKVYYSGYAFDPEFVPSGMIPDEDSGWSQGSLFTTPKWLLKQIDLNMTSSVLDFGFTPTPTPVPPGEVEEFISSGYAALEGGNYRIAYTAFKTATELDPSSSEAWYGAGIALENQKRYLSALDAYSRAISLDGEPKTEWRLFAGKGRVCYVLNRFAEAKSALETAVTLYEKTGASDPDELKSINRLLTEIEQKSNIPYINPGSAYVPPIVSGVTNY